MIFTMMKDKEITKRAKELDGYYTAEFAIGYMMIHHPILLVLDIIIPMLVLFPILWMFCR